MTNKKLFELLKLVDGVDFSYWSMVNHLVDCINENKSIVIEKEWKNYKKDFPDSCPLDLSKISTWSTYDKCVDVNFTNVNEKLYCKVKIYEGDTFDGYRKDLRFTATLILPDKFIKQIANTIEACFEYYLSKSYEKHLEAKKKQWIYEKRNEILGGLS